MLVLHSVASFGILHSLVLTAHIGKNLFAFVGLCLGLLDSYRSATEAAFAFCQFCPAQPCVFIVTSRGTEMCSPACSVCWNHIQTLSFRDTRPTGHYAVKLITHSASPFGLFPTAAYF